MDIAIASYHTRPAGNISLVNLPPDQCENLEQVRAGMDAVDREIISLIATRVAYVRAAARYKPTEDSVADPERRQKVLSTRRAWAEEAGLDGVAIEALYRDLVTYCISEEHKYWSSIKS
jgi:isochorismate pyruvate lyase